MTAVELSSRMHPCVVLHCGVSVSDGNPRATKPKLQGRPHQHNGVNILRPARTYLRCRLHLSAVLLEQSCAGRKRQCRVYTEIRGTHKYFIR